MAIHGIAMKLALPLQRHYRIANVRRLDITPVQLRGVTTYGEVELRRQSPPHRRERRIETANLFTYGSQRARSRDDVHDRPCDRGDEPIEREWPMRPTNGAARQRLHQTGDDVGGGPKQTVEKFAGFRCG